MLMFARVLWSDIAPGDKVYHVEGTSTIACIQQNYFGVIYIYIIFSVCG